MRMMKRTLHRPAATIAAAILGLSLVGCSSDPAETPTNESGGDSATNVYEFQTNGIEPSEEITVRVPDDLREVMGADADGMVVDEIVVTGHELEGAEYCSADLTIAYGNDQPQALLSAGSDQTQRSDKEQSLLDAFGVSSIDEVIVELDETIDGMQDWPLARMPQELASRVGHEIGIYYEGGDTGQSLVDRYLDSPESTETTDAQIIASGLGLPRSDEARSLADLNESAPEPGTYVSDDRGTVTVVGDCAASATDPDNSIDLVLPSLEGSETSTIAMVQLSVMTDGTIGVAGEVDEFMRDANGNWIAS